MERRKKREYETPAMQVVEMKLQPQLLAGSTQDTATIDDFEDGGMIIWNGAPEFFNIENELFSW